MRQCCPRYQYDEGSSEYTKISGLNHRASAPAVYASRPASPPRMPDSLPGGGEPFPGGSRTLWAAKKVSVYYGFIVFPLPQALPAAHWLFCWTELGGRQSLRKGKVYEPVEDGNFLCCPEGSTPSR